MSDPQNGRSWRERLDTHESPMDTTAFWRELEPRLPQRNRRGGIFMAWWVLGIVGLLFGTWWIWDSNVSNNYFADQAYTTSTFKDHKADQSEMNLSSEVTSIHDNRPSQTLLPNVSNTVMTNHLSYNDGSKRVPQLAMVQHVNNMVDPTFLRKDDSDESTVLYEAAELTKPDEAINVVAASGNANISFDEFDILNMKESTSPKLQGDEQINADAAQNLYTEHGETLTSDSVSDEHAFTPDSQVNPSEEMFLSLPKPVQQYWSGSFDLIGGLGYTAVQWMANEPTHTGYIRVRRNSEKPSASWSLGADIRVYTPLGLFLQTGIRYQALRQRFDSEMVVNTRYTYEDTKGTLVSVNGTQSNWEGPALRATIQYRRVRNYNQLATWDLPVALGYRHVWSRWSGDIAAGLVFNLRQNATGKSLTPEHEIGVWGASDALAYRSRIGVGSMLQGRLVWEQPRWGSFFIQPVWLWTYGPRNANTVAGYAISQDAFFLQVGFSYRLF